MVKSILSRAWHHNIYLVLKMVINSVFCEKDNISKKRYVLRHCVRNSQRHEFSKYEQSLITVRVAKDSLQHEAHNEIYGIEAFYYLPDSYSIRHGTDYKFS